MAKIYGGTTTTPINPNAFAGGGNTKVDQTYNPESENAQSGKAVAAAIENNLDKMADLQTQLNEKTNVQIITWEAND